MLSITPPSSRRAFSLVEIVVTIVVIALIAGVAVPMLGNVFDRSQDAAARRDAQQIAGVASSASAAGSTAISAAADKEEAVDLIVNGITGEGQFSENVFMVGLDDDAREKTLKYLEFNNGQLAFDPDKE